MCAGKRCCRQCEVVSASICVREAVQCAESREWQAERQREAERKGAEAIEAGMQAGRGRWQRRKQQSRREREAREKESERGERVP